MQLRHLACLVSALVWCTPAAAQDLDRAAPESVGMSPAGLGAATAALQAHIDEGHIAGVVAAVARHGKLVYFEALGVRDLEVGDAMPDDAIFRLYSMTRSITSTAVMLLWEEGPSSWTTQFPTISRSSRRSESSSTPRRPTSNGRGRVKATSRSVTC
mgnify:CR=1 FL=1